MNGATTSSTALSNTNTSSAAMNNTARTIHLYGANIDTDVILPGKYLNLYTPEDLGPHCFARIFYRNAINIGLPVFECADIVAAVKNGEAIEADIAKGLFTVNGVAFQAKPFPPYIQDIINAGGLVPFVSRQLKQN